MFFHDGKILKARTGGSLLDTRLGYLVSNGEVL